MGADRRFPLAWPAGWKRAARKKHSSLRTRGNPLSVYTATERLIGEMRRLGASDFILSANVPLRRDGWPRSDAREPADNGVAVYFTLNKRQQVLACDAFTTVADNIGAVARHIEALRTMDRYCVGTMQQAFAGYVALPPPIADAVDWRAVLRCKPQATLADAERQYRALALEHHADVGGTHEAMVKLNEAIAAARKEFAS